MTGKPTASTRLQNCCVFFHGPGEGVPFLSECHYLLRFDDICPTMNWAIWEAIERHLVLHDVRPILAVVPDNRDSKLMCDPPLPEFWDRVRRWQEMGYTIALHGYQHVYVNQERGLTRLTPQSEFAGLSYQEQQAKLQKAVAIFAEQGVRVDAFVAPSHSFDRTTLKVLAELGVKVVSDGLWPWPHADKNGMFWVPQQLWDFRRRPAGTWTVCNHHNSWTKAKVEALGENLTQHAGRMTDLARVAQTFAGRPLSITDRIWALGDLMWNHRIKAALWRLRRRWKKAGHAS